MKPSWLPDNPFWNEPILGADKALGVGFDYGSIAGAKSVLEYILRNPMEFSSSDLSRHNTIQMLKEIE